MTKTPCRYYAQGNCSFGNRCRFEHIGRVPSGATDSVQSGYLSKSDFLNKDTGELAAEIITDIQQFQKIQIRPVLSSYGLECWPTTNVIAGRDVSLEELRLQYFEAAATNNIASYDKNLDLRKRDMDYCISEVLLNAALAARYLQKSVNQIPVRGFVNKSLDENITDFSRQSHPTGGVFGSTNVSNPFGSSAAFGNATSNPFGGQKATNNGRISAPGSQSATAFNMNNAFGSSGFGQSGFGSSSTNSGVFGSKPGAFGQQNIKISQNGGFGSLGFSLTQSGSAQRASGAFGGQQGTGAFGNKQDAAGISGASSVASGFGTSGFGALGQTSGAGGFGTSGFGGILNKNSAFGSSGITTNTGGASSFGGSSFGSAANIVSPFAAAAKNTLTFGQINVPTVGHSSSQTFGHTNTLAFGNKTLFSGQSNLEPRSNGTLVFTPRNTTAFGQNTQLAFGQASNQENLAFGSQVLTLGAGISNQSEPDSPFSFGGQAAAQMPCSNASYAPGQVNQPAKSIFFESSSSGGTGKTIFGQNPIMNQAQPNQFVSIPTEFGSSVRSSSQSNSTGEGNLDACFEKYDPKAKQAFLAREFELGAVPEVPPPPEVC